MPDLIHDKPSIKSGENVLITDDITSLFTKILLDETLDIVVNLEKIIES